MPIPTYGDVKRALERLVQELHVLNESVAVSLVEGLEDRLTLHQLQAFVELSVTFHRTTNLVDSIMTPLEAKTRHVTHWKTSD